MSAWPEATMSSIWLPVGHFGTVEAVWDWLVSVNVLSSFFVYFVYFVVPSLLRLRLDLPK
jgi:hypothetical protein